MARIVIASGGTGGHFYPGFSLGVALREKGHEVLFLVRQEDPALPLLEKSGFAALPLGVLGLPRRPGPRLVSFFWGMGCAFATLRKAFRAWRPEAVVGMGAYVSFPAVAAAWWRGVPVLIHESNAEFGLANRIESRFAAKVCLGLPMNGPSPSPLPGERGEGVVLTGTPIREALWQSVEPGAARLGLGLEREQRTVLVFGGSQGAGRINAVAPGALAAASEELGGLQVLHLSGARDQAAVEQAYRAREVRAVVLPYLESMELAFGAADLVVCRSGASTLAELISQRKPAILVPYPYATGGHQTRNARRLEKAGAATLLMEETLSEEALAARVADLLRPENGKTLERMRRAYDALAVPTGKSAVEALVGAVEGLLK